MSLWHCVVWWPVTMSEELPASICRVATFQTRVVTQKKCSPLTMEAAVSSKTMVITCWTTYCNIPEVFYTENQGSCFLQHVGSPTVPHDLISQKKSSVLKTEVTIFSETLVTTWCNNPPVLWPSRWKQQFHVKCWKPNYQITVIQNNSSTLKMETFSSSIYQMSQFNNLFFILPWKRKVPVLPKTLVTNPPDYIVSKCRSLPCKCIEQVHPKYW